MPQDLARGKAAGFVDYLTKPLELDRILGVMDTWLHSADDGNNLHGKEEK